MHLKIQPNASSCCQFSIRVSFGLFFNSSIAQNILAKAFSIPASLNWLLWMSWRACTQINTQPAERKWHTFCQTSKQPNKHLPPPPSCLLNQKSNPTPMKIHPEQQPPPSLSIYPKDNNNNNNNQQSTPTISCHCIISHR